ncbi:MAG TPA: hypothetical protein VK582_07570 [Pyrinomonadaceae bacterium]|nr:hypothetical protein [Pyrinomonadaceae bacterium]
MKFLVISRPGSNLPQLPSSGYVDLAKGSKKWLDDMIAKGTAECGYALHNHGGVLILNAKSHEDVHGMLVNHPLHAFYNWEIEPLLDADQTHKQNIKYLTSLAA